MRRRPLLRAAAVGGGAYALGKHRARAQEEQQEAAYTQGQQAAYGQEQQSAVATAPSPRSAGITSDDATRLQELGRLHEQGILTDDEFAQQKALILGGR